MSDLEQSDVKTTWNRWITVFGAIIIQLALGTIYSWGSTFARAYKEMYEASHPESLQYAKLYANIPFGIGLAAFAVAMIFAGKLQDEKGPKPIAMVGGALLGAGYILSAILPMNFFYITITYGIVAGAGIGFGYVCPIASASKWFPDKKGLIAGLAVAGFGAGAFIFNYIIKYFIDSLGLGTAYFLTGLIFL
ncbi:MAG: MFS transporter, partial [Promethearchaeota archaeon]